ncbi:hypothetical protein OPV22_011718 [Ensete ventricosum]|uniref:Uncharacterized protein n=1 Tax=Ensete ventricosum TaxID=4639 RepID=A0AAV8RE42_ENSVE|nr:hypothetical protein OPV22_011718 [Ensete ventricosum]
MASRALACWRSLASARQFTTSTAPRMRPMAPTADDVLGHHAGWKPKPRGEFVPVYVALGLILLSASFGIHTAMQQLRYSPNVLVSKKKRETVPEVVEPDWAAEEAERFISGSVFRRVAHLQDFDAVWAGNSNPARGHVINRPRKVETLKSVGVDPSSLG